MWREIYMKYISFPVSSIGTFLYLKILTRDVVTPSEISQEKIIQSIRNPAKSYPFLPDKDTADVL